MPKNVLKANNEMHLYGTVGMVSFWDDDGFTLADVAEALAQVGRNTDVTIRLNSGGGIAWEGSAIYSLLSAHRGNKKIIVDGVAASAASIIAMAGDEVIMSAGSVMMVHDPSFITLGTAQDHEKSIEMLNALGDSMAEIYSEKTGRDVEEIRSEMKEEIWMKPDVAVSKGYADKVDRKAKAKEATAFDYRLYQHAPERMVALAKAKHWSIPTGLIGERKKEEVKMAEDTETSKDTENKETKETTTTTTTTESQTAETQQSGGGASQNAAETSEEVKAERKRAADIFAACNIAGKPSLAADFVAQGKSLSEVVNALSGLPNPGKPQSSAAGAADEINSRRTNAPGASQANGSAIMAKHVERLNKRTQAQIAKGRTK